MRDNTSGKRWARFGLGVGAALSIAGNVAHTVLTASTVPIALRIVFAVVWPAGLFIGIEVLVRVQWRRRLIDHVGRGVLVLPLGAVAAIVSYRHLHSLMVSGAEDSISATLGPLAIDGLMIGCTVALLAIRSHALETSGDISASILRLEEFANGAGERSAERIREEETAEEFSRELAELLETEEQSTPRRARTPRGEASPDQVRAAFHLISGGKPGDIDYVSRTVAGRIAKVTRTLRDNPHAEIDAKAEKVHPEIVNIIRAEMRKEATR